MNRLKAVKDLSANQNQKPFKKARDNTDVFRYPRTSKKETY